MSPVNVGHVVGGKYELARLLGRGSMGEVWVAHHRTLGQDLALKLLAPASPTIDVEGPSVAAARFRFEAQVAARLSRKTRHIVRVTDHGEEEDGLAYLVMELLEGKTLEQTLLFRPLPPADVARLVTQTARALEHAHAEGVVHRDLKPGNIFLTHDEEGGLLTKLLDFGIARTMRTQRILGAFATGDGLVFGTPGYMSPEQACGTKVNAHADLWALATVAYEALTGDLPHPGSAPDELLRSLHAGRLVPVHERNPALPWALAEFFETAFAARIGRRFASASQLALAFEQAIVARGNPPAGTWPMPIPLNRPGDTLPMEFDAQPGSNGPAPKQRAARVGTAWFVAGAALLGGAIAGQCVRTSLATRGAAALSGSPPLADSATTGLERDEPRSSEPAPSAFEPSPSEEVSEKVSVISNGRVESRVSHPTQSGPSSLPHAPPPAAAMRAPPPAGSPAAPVSPAPADALSTPRPIPPPSRTPTDKSAIL
jgi:serine/threonine-protein kinase